MVAKSDEEKEPKAEIKENPSSVLENNGEILSLPNDSIADPDLKGGDNLWFN